MYNVVPLCHQIDIRYATIVQPDFTIRVHLVGFFIATVSYRYSVLLSKFILCIIKIQTSLKLNIKLLN